LASQYPFNPQLPPALILGNGSYPTGFDLHQIRVKHPALVVCADGGAAKARELGIVPNLIIGDLDSVSDETLAYFRSVNVKIKRLAGQENNDLEKCIRCLLRIGQRQMILIGFSGRRDDQTIATLQIVRKYMSRVQFLIHTETSEIWPLTRGEWLFPTANGQVVSLFGFPRAQAVTTNGLQFPLKAENLSSGSRGVSNVALGNSISIQFNAGNLLVVKNQVGA